MTNAILRGKSYAGNPHVRFDEGKVASEKSRRGSLLYRSNLKKHFSFVALAALGAFSASAMDFVSDLKRDFPLGVYWGWESVTFNAEVAGLSRTNYVDKLLGVIAQHNCDTVWIVNGPSNPGGQTFLSLCEKHGIRALLNSAHLDFFYHGWNGDGARLQEAARKSVERYGASPSLLAYVLKDEPLLCSVQQIDGIYDIMKREDPHKRDSVVVAMTPHAQTYIEDSSLPVVCMDIYHFGGDYSGNIPNPSRTSQRQYRLTLRGFVQSALQSGKNAWVMPMAFGDTWGPHYWDAKGRHWAEPGAYRHWRMPTIAETRWQAWEAVRAGAKGIVYYYIEDAGRYRVDKIKEGGSQHARYQKGIAQVEAMKAKSPNKRQFLSERLEIEKESALCDPGAKPTPQFDALGVCFGRIRPHRARLLASRPSSVPAFYSSDPDCVTGTLSDPSSTELTGVLVNDDVTRARTFTVCVPSSTASVRDLNGGTLALSGAKDGLRTFSVTLKPGDGMLLAATFEKGFAGLPVLHEDFRRINWKGNVAKENRKIEPYGAFHGCALRALSRTGDFDKPVFTVSNLTNPKTPVNTFTMNANARRRDGYLWLSAEGNLRNCEIRAVLDGKAAALQTDVYHLEAGKDAGGAAASAAPTKTVWRSDGKVDGAPTCAIPGRGVTGRGMLMPISLPVGTTGLEFYLGDDKSFLTDVRIWFTPKEGK